MTEAFFLGWNKLSLFDTEPDVGEDFLPQSGDGRAGGCQRYHKGCIEASVVRQNSYNDIELILLGMWTVGQVLFI